MAKSKVETVMHEGKAGHLHSGSKHGPLVKHGSKQEIAIALSEARKAGEDLPPEHHSNPTEYYGSGDTPSISDGGGPLQAVDPMESMDQFEEGCDEFQMDYSADKEWPGVKVKQRPRRQAY